jgi:hypothetical protein
MVIVSMPGPGGDLQDEAVFILDALIQALRRQNPERRHRQNYAM